MNTRQVRGFLLLALGALVLAAWTGVLMRVGMVNGFPSWAQNYGAIRHAHSHLMYFGWVTLALMALIWADLPRYTGQPLPRGAGLQMGLTAVMAFLSFPAFWTNGYGLTEIGSARLPLGSMVSAFNGLTWFFFMFLYGRATHRLHDRPIALQLWDWALVLLGLASMGALGLMTLVFLRIEHPFLQQLFLHQFLDLFAAGWFSLAMLGMLWSHLGIIHMHRLPTFSLALLLAPTFLLGVSPAVLPQSLFWIAAVSNAVAAILLGVHVARLWRRRADLPSMTWLYLGGMAVLIAIALALLIPDVWRQSASGQLRVFYLHLLLLVWVSTALIALLQYRMAPGSNVVRYVVNPLWAGGVLMMVGSLLGLGLSPWTGTPQLFWLQVAAWSSIAIAASATLLLVRLLAYGAAAMTVFFRLSGASEELS